MCNNVYSSRNKGDRLTQPESATSKLSLVLLMSIFWLGVLHKFSESS